MELFFANFFSGDTKGSVKDIPQISSRLYIDYKFHYRPSYWDIQECWCIFMIYICLSNILDNIKLWHDDEFSTSRGEGKGVSLPAGLPLQFGKANHAQMHLRANMFQCQNFYLNKHFLIFPIYLSRCKAVALRESDILSKSCGHGGFLKC